MVLEAVKLYPGSVDRRAKAEEWNEVGDLLLTVKWTLQLWEWDLSTSNFYCRLECE